MHDGLVISCGVERVGWREVPEVLVHPPNGNDVSTGDVLDFRFGELRVLGHLRADGEAFAVEARELRWVRLRAALRLEEEASGRGAGVLAEKASNGGEERALAVAARVAVVEDENVLVGAPGERVADEPLQVGRETQRAAHGRREERGPDGRPRFEVVVHVDDLRDEILAIVWTKFSRAEVDCAIRDVQAPRVRVEVRHAHDEAVLEPLRDGLDLPLVLRVRVPKEQLRFALEERLEAADAVLVLLRHELQRAKLFLKRFDSGAAPVVLLAGNQDSGAEDATACTGELPALAGPREPRGPLDAKAVALAVGADERVDVRRVRVARSFGLELLDAQRFGLLDVGRLALVVEIDHRPDSRFWDVRRGAAPRIPRRPCPRGARSRFWPPATERDGQRLES